MSVTKIISGGQTGVDRAALDAAIHNAIAHGGWCPRGRKAEDGGIERRYMLRETDSSDYSVRTTWNVRDADGTLVLNNGRPEGGTALTIQVARNMHKPWLLVDLGGNQDPDLIWRWIREHDIKILNIAGPRESRHPGIYALAFKLLDALYKKINTEAQRTQRI
jgi:hypothetical protein